MAGNLEMRQRSGKASDEEQINPSQVGQGDDLRGWRKQREGRTREIRGKAKEQAEKPMGWDGEDDWMKHRGQGRVIQGREG